jgi:hypothetical protein
MTAGDVVWSCPDCTTDLDGTTCPGCGRAWTWLAMPGGLRGLVASDRLEP